MNSVTCNLLNKIILEREDFDILVNADNSIGLNVTSEDIINFLEFTTDDQVITSPIIGNIIITEGDILSVLKTILSLSKYEGNYKIFINEDNMGTNAYLVSRANDCYKELNLNIEIEIDFNENYNKYVNDMVTLIGSKDFIETASVDFNNPNKIIV